MLSPNACKVTLGGGGFAIGSADSNCGKPGVFRRIDDVSAPASGKGPTIAEVTAVRAQAPGLDGSHQPSPLYLDNALPADSDASIAYLCLAIGSEPMSKIRYAAAGEGRSRGD